ncbi:hypothetical protein OH799_16770 [Nocardia sp. NBC_00881]|nr:hypothetical protein OH799_16770 [Nocardia sp. NBC_00881]
MADRAGRGAFRRLHGEPLWLAGYVGVLDTTIKHGAALDEFHRSLS